MRNIRSETSFRSSESTTSKENERTLSKPSPIRRWFFTMCLANVTLDKTVLSGSLCVFRKQKWLQERLATHYRLRVGNLWTFLKRTAVSHTNNVLRKQIKIWNLYGCLWKIAVRIGFYKLGLWHRGRWNSGGRWESRRIFLAGRERKNPPIVRRAKIFP